MPNVIFYCHNCQHSNNQEAGRFGYEWRQVSFRSFTDAMNHVTQYGHDIYAVTEDEETND